MREKGITQKLRSLATAVRVAGWVNRKLHLRTYRRHLLLLLLLLLLSPPAQSRRQKKTRLDIQNYGCNGNLLCCHSVVERNRISSLQSHGKALEKNVVSRMFSVIVVDQVIRLPISCVSSMAMSCHVPAVFFYYYYNSCWIFLFD